MTLTATQKSNALMLIAIAAMLYIVFKPKTAESMVYIKKGTDDAPKKAIFD